MKSRIMIAMSLLLAAGGPGGRELVKEVTAESS